MVVKVAKYDIATYDIGLSGDLCQWAVIFLHNVLFMALHKLYISTKIKLQKGFLFRRYGAVLV